MTTDELEDIRRRDAETVLHEGRAILDRRALLRMLVRAQCQVVEQRIALHVTHRALHSLATKYGEQPPQALPTFKGIDAQMEVNRMDTMDSTSDQRVTNNVMRHEYRVLSALEKEQMQAVKDKGLELYELIRSLGTSEELTIAATRAREAVMWAVNHVTR